MQYLTRTALALASTLVLSTALHAQGPQLSISQTPNQAAGTVVNRFSVSGANPNSLLYLYYGDMQIPGIPLPFGGTLYIDPPTLGLIDVIPIDASGSGAKTLSYPLTFPDFRVVMQGLVLTPGGGVPPQATDAIQVGNANSLGDCSHINGDYYFNTQNWDIFILGDPGAAVRVVFYEEGAGPGVELDQAFVPANGELLLFGHQPMDEDDVIEVECNGQVILELSCT